MSNKAIGVDMARPGAYRCVEIEYQIFPDMSKGMTVVKELNGSGRFCPGIASITNGTGQSILALPSVRLKSEGLK